MPYLKQEEYDELKSEARYYKSLYESEAKAKASIMADGFKAFGNNGLLESWEHQAAALRAENARLRELANQIVLAVEEEKARIPADIVEAARRALESSNG